MRTWSIHSTVPSFVRIRVAVAVVAVAALALGACGTGSGTQSQRHGATRTTPLELVAASADRTAAAKTSKLALDMSVTGSDAVTISGDGDLDYVTARARLDLNVSNASNGVNARISERLVGNAVYLDMSGIAPSGFDRALGGRRWLKVDIGDDALRRAGFGDTSALGSSDPSQILQALRGVADVREVGHDDVRGVDTTHYAADVDLQKAIASTPSQDRNDARRALGMLGSTTIPLDVWVDAQGRARRLTVHADTSTFGTSGSAFTMTVEVYDFGTSVDVQPPPADDTIDLTALYGGASARRPRHDGGASRISA